MPQSPLDADGNVQAAYYSNVVRTLDQNYTLELERLRKEHEQALATTRHNIDQAYREQWKAKNREIERIREQTAAAKDAEVNDVRLELSARIDKLEAEVGQLKDELDRQGTRSHKII